MVPLLLEECESFPGNGSNLAIYQANPQFSEIRARSIEREINRAKIRGWLVWGQDRA